MIVILFIVLLIIILLYIYIQSKNHFIVNVINGTEVKDAQFNEFNDLKNTNIYLGDSVEQDFITYDTQFKFKISSKENRYEISKGTTIRVEEKVIYLRKEDNTEDSGYNNYFIYIKYGKYERTRKIIGYERSTKKATVDDEWSDIPPVSSPGFEYSIFSYEPVANSTDIKPYYAEYNLFNGINCPQQESSDACFKRNSNFVYEALLSKDNDDIVQTTAAAGQTNKDKTNMLWKFFDIERSGNKYIHYGDELILKNLGKTVSYLCLCDTNPIDVETCGTVYNMYCYDDLKDAEIYGKWIIIPKYFRTDYYKNNISKENTNPFRKYTGGLKDKNRNIVSDNYTQYLLYNEPIKIKSIYTNKYINCEDEDNCNPKLTTENTTKFIIKKQTDPTDPTDNNEIHYGDFITIYVNNKKIYPDIDTYKLFIAPNKKDFHGKNFELLISKTIKESSIKEYRNKKYKVNLNDSFYIIALYLDGSYKYMYVYNESIKFTVNHSNPKSVSWSFEKAINYDFHNDYDMANLKSKKIPISVKDEFLIINSLPVNGKYVYLNICNNLENNPWLQLNCYNNKYSKVIGTSPSLNKFGIFNTDKLEMEVFNWSIKPIKYNVNVKDTLFVLGSLDIGSDDNKTTLTSDKLRYIKSMPYYFKNKICLKGKDNIPNCIEKHHIEMLNGSRPINIQSITQSKPFKLYSGLDYSGRELRIGFNYNDANNLPYYGDFNEWLNPGDHGKWKSLKIDGPYNAIIYSKPNFGFGTTGEKINDNFNLTQDEANAIVAREKTIEEIKDVQYDKAIEEGRMPDFEITNTILEKETVNPLYYVVSSPGISDVTKLGDEWVNGIRSIKFIKDSKEYYELKCLEKYPFTYQPNTDESSVTEELITANLCKNGSTNQQFYFSGENDNIYEPDNYNNNISGKHIHFHRHPYDSTHEGVSLPLE